MTAAKKIETMTWSASPSPNTLTDIVSEGMSVAVWQREYNHVIASYFEEVFSSLGLGIRGVYSMDTLKSSLSERLPDGYGRSEAIEDIFLLSDMLTYLFNCDSVGLRLAPLTSAMCPKLHVDQIPLRLVNTYLGEGTEWLPNELLFEHPSAKTQTKLKTAVHSGYYNNNSLNQLNAFDVAMLKGSAWQEGLEQMSAIHRSCAVKPNSKRVLLTLDPI